MTAAMRTRGHSARYFGGVDPHADAWYPMAGTMAAVRWWGRGGALRRPSVGIRMVAGPHPCDAGAAGNVATEDVVYMLNQMRITTDVDLPALVKVAHWTEGIVGRQLPGRVKDAGVTSAPGPA